MPSGPAAPAHLSESAATAIQLDRLAAFVELLDLANDEAMLATLFLKGVRRRLRPASAALLLVQPDTLEFAVSQAVPKRSWRRWEAELEAQIEAGAFARAIGQRGPVALPPLGRASAASQSILLTPLLARYLLFGTLLIASPWPASAVPPAVLSDLALSAKHFSVTLGLHRLIAELRRQNGELTRVAVTMDRQMADLRQAHDDLNEAHAALREKTGELERLSAALEAKVSERTAELRLLNRRLEHLSRTDDLTQLLNRRSFEERLNAEETRRGRTGRPSTVVMVDLNGLKAINDQFGHAAGDEALMATAACLRAVARASDVVARLGGDEFAILLTETGQSGAAAFCRRLARAVEQVRPWRDAAVSLSLAIGYASCPPAGSLHEALRIADARMYVQKRAHYAQHRLAERALAT